MKKKHLLIGTLILISAFTLTGCNKAKVKTDTKYLVELKGAKVTANTYYDSIKEDQISKLIDMIDHKLFDKKYETTDEENKSVDNQITNIKKIYANDDDDQFQSVMEQYFGVKTKKELEEKIHLDYKRDLAVDDFIMDNFSDRELKNYYNNNYYSQMKASHILIKSDAKADASSKEKEAAEAKAKEKAEDIIKKLKNGEKFEDLAKKYSEDTSNASNGGDLGYFDLDSMSEQFSEAVKKLKVDEYTKAPVKTEYGYHIILKTGEKKKTKFEKVKDEIKEKMKDEKMADDPTLYYKTLEDIRESKKIKWNDSTMKRAYNRYMDNLIEQAKKSGTSTNTEE